MSEDKKLQDQFQILFDDAEDGLGQKKAEKESFEPVKMIDFDEIEESGPAEVKTQPERPLRSVERETQEERIKRFSYEMGEEEEDEPERPVRKAPKNDTVDHKPAKKSNYKKESIRFLIFSIIIALLAAGAILFILFSRGILGGTPKETTAPETTKAPEDTTAPSNEEPDETTETAPDETTETAPEETTEEPSTEPNPAAAVLDNYTNLFVTSAPLLNIRKAASTDSAIIGQIAQFAGGEILDTQGDWLHIRSGSIDGFVKAEYVLTGDKAKDAAVKHAKLHVVVNDDAVNVRSGPGTNFDIVTRALRGAVLSYINTENGFYKVYYDENNTKVGYVSTSYTKLDYYLDGAVKPMD